MEAENRGPGFFGTKKGGRGGVTSALSRGKSRGEKWPRVLESARVIRGSAANIVVHDEPRAPVTPRDDWDRLDPISRRFDAFNLYYAISLTEAVQRWLSGRARFAREFEGKANLKVSRGDARLRSAYEASLLRSLDYSEGVLELRASREFVSVNIPR